MAAGDDPVRVLLNEDGHRYEVWTGDELAGFASFRKGPDRVTIFHAEVGPAHEGRGLGSRLAAGALDDLRARGLGVVPSCPFMAAYVGEHPEYADLVRE
jgi:predicted GNAT family acetyltransferase